MVSFNMLQCRMQIYAGAQQGMADMPRARQLCSSSYLECLPNTQS